MIINLAFPVKAYFIATFIYGLSFITSFMKNKISIFLLFIGFLLNLISDISGRYLVWPYCNMFSEPYFLPLFLSGFCLSSSFLFLRGRNIKYTTLFIFGLSLVPLFCSEGYYPPFTLMSKSIYAHFFHLFLFIGHGFMFISAYLALLSLIIDRDYLFLSYRYSLFGFVILCITGFFGMIWSYVGRGDVISWNHYYFHSVGIWFYYIALFHLYPEGLLSRKKGVLLIVVGAVLIFLFDYIPQVGGIHKPVLNERLYGIYQ